MKPPPFEDEKFGVTTFFSPNLCFRVEDKIGTSIGKPNIALTSYVSYCINHTVGSEEASVPLHEAIARWFAVCADEKNPGLLNFKGHWFLLKLILR